MKWLRRSEISIGSYDKTQKRKIPELEQIYCLEIEEMDNETYLSIFYIESGRFNNIRGLEVKIFQEDFIARCQDKANMFFNNAEVLDGYDAEFDTSDESIYNLDENKLTIRFIFNVKDRHDYIMLNINPLESSIIKCNSEIFAKIFIDFKNKIAHILNTLNKCISEIPDDVKLLGEIK